MAELTIQERSQLILQYVCNEGYAFSKHIAAYLKTHTTYGTSIENTRKSLQSFCQSQLMEFKELSDTKEKVYFLTCRGLEALGENKEETADYEKRLKQINFRHIRHYFLEKQVEKTLCVDVSQGGIYSAQSINEFTDKDGRLYVRMKDNPEMNLMSDGEIRIFKNGFERLAFRIEIDTGTEAIISQIKSKLDNYFLYFQSSQIETEYDTYPVYLLVVTSQERVDTIITKLGQHSVMSFVLFLPLERIESFSIDAKWLPYLDEKKLVADLRKEIKQNNRKLSSNAIVEVIIQGKEWLVHDEENRIQYTITEEKNQLMVQESVNLFSSLVIADSQKRLLSLSSLAEKRELLLCFRNAVQEAIKVHPEYEIFVHTIFSMPHQDPFFPMLITVLHEQKLWEPDGYIKIRKKRSDNQLEDVLFALVFCLENGNDRDTPEFMEPCEIFFQDKTCISKIMPVPMPSGCLVICREEEQIRSFLESARDFKIQNRVRCILYSDCVSSKIFNEPVWRTESCRSLTFFKQSLPIENTPSVKST